jgi:hypothetical protein
MLYHTIYDIELIDTEHELLSETELRVIAYVKSKNYVDYWIDIEFEVKQSGEETQVKTLTFTIEARQEQEFSVDFTVNPTKDKEFAVQIVNQHSTVWGVGHE